MLEGNKLVTLGAEAMEKQDRERGSKCSQKNKTVVRKLLYRNFVSPKQKTWLNDENNSTKTHQSDSNVYPVNSFLHR